MNATRCTAMGLAAAAGIIVAGHLPVMGDEPDSQPADVGTVTVTEPGITPGITAPVWPNSEVGEDPTATAVAPEPEPETWYVPVDNPDLADIVSDAMDTGRDVRVELTEPETNPAPEVKELDPVDEVDATLCSTAGNLACGGFTSPHVPGRTFAVQFDAAGNPVSVYETTP